MLVALSHNPKKDFTSVPFLRLQDIGAHLMEAYEFIRKREIFTHNKIQTTLFRRKILWSKDILKWI